MPFVAFPGFVSCVKKLGARLFLLGSLDLAGPTGFVPGANMLAADGEMFWRVVMHAGSREKSRVWVASARLALA